MYADDSNQRDVTGLGDEGLSQPETFISYFYINWMENYTWCGIWWQENFKTLQQETEKLPWVIILDQRRLDINAGMESLQCPYQSWGSLTPAGWRGLHFFQRNHSAISFHFCCLVSQCHSVTLELDHNPSINASKSSTKPCNSLIATLWLRICYLTKLQVAANPHDRTSDCTNHRCKTINNVSKQNSKGDHVN